MKTMDPVTEQQHKTAKNTNRHVRWKEANHWTAIFQASSNPNPTLLLHKGTNRMMDQQQQDVRSREEKEKIFDDDKNGWQEKRTEVVVFTHWTSKWGSIGESDRWVKGSSGQDWKLNETGMSPKEMEISWENDKIEDEGNDGAPPPTQMCNIFTRLKVSQKNTEIHWYVGLN